MVTAQKKREGNVCPQAFKGLSTEAFRIRNMDGFTLLIYVLEKLFPNIHKCES